MNHDYGKFNVVRWPIWQVITINAEGNKIKATYASDRQAHASMVSKLQAGELAWVKGPIEDYGSHEEQ